MAEAYNEKVCARILMEELIPVSYKCPKCGREDGEISVIAVTPVEVSIRMRTGEMALTGLVKSSGVLHTQRAVCIDCNYSGQLVDFYWVNGMRYQDIKV